MKNTTDNVLIVGAPALHPDIYFATGYSSFDPVIFLRARGRQCLVVSPLDYAHVRRVARNTRVISSSDFRVRRHSRSPLCDRVAALLRMMRLRSVAVPFDFPAGLFQFLANRRVKVSFSERSFFPGREVKSARELAFITIAQQTAARAMKGAVDMIAACAIGRDGRLRLGRRPLTAAAVRREIDSIALSRGCVCHGTIVACGAQAANPHEIGWGTLRAHRPIVIDIFPRHIESGYWGDLTRTVLRGEAAPEIVAMHAAVRDAQKLALSQIHAGVSTATIHRAAVELFRERGFFTGRRNGRSEGFIHAIGHGIGLEIHENPSVGPVNRKLRSGNVITVEPGLYYPGKTGIRIEDTVCVTKSGCRRIAPADYKFVL